jgi:hypothetical protein
LDTDDATSARATDAAVGESTSAPVSNHGQMAPAPAASELAVPETSASIEMQVRITLEGNVSDSARRQIVESVQSLTEKFAAKVREVEEDERVAGATNPEYTASTVIKANEMLKRQNNDTQTGPVFIALALLVPICSSAAGILGSSLHSVWQSALFGAAAVAAVIGIVLTLLLPKLRSK